MNREGKKEGDGSHGHLLPFVGCPSSPSWIPEDAQEVWIMAEGPTPSPSPDDLAPVQLIKWDSGSFPSRESFTWRSIVQLWPGNISPETAQFIRSLGSTKGAEFMKDEGVLTSFEDLPASPKPLRDGWTHQWTTNMERVCDHSSFKTPTPWCPRLVSSESRRMFELGRQLEWIQADILKIQENGAPRARSSSSSQEPHHPTASSVGKPLQKRGQSPGCAPPLNEITRTASGKGYNTYSDEESGFSRPPHDVRGQFLDSGNPESLAAMHQSGQRVDAVSATDGHNDYNAPMTARSVQGGPLSADTLVDSAYRYEKLLRAQQQLIREREFLKICYNIDQYLPDHLQKEEVDKCYDVHEQSSGELHQAAMIARHPGFGEAGYIFGGACLFELFRRAILDRGQRADSPPHRPQRAEQRGRCLSLSREA
jgi:hypothetical protein